MTEGSTGELYHSAAQAMLNCFASVGASHFDVTLTTRGGEKCGFRRSVPLAELTRALPGMLDSAASSERNVIVRPHGPGIVFLQLDDLASDRLPALAPAVFLTLETSPGNFQAWLALPGKENKEFARRGRDRQRRNTRRREPEFQGQVRARLPARQNSDGTAWPDDGPDRA